MMKVNDFAVLILTHGRANNVTTVKTLRRQGYTGEIFFVVDNEDDQADRYKENFGTENVIIFDKEKYFELTDTGDNGGNRAVVVPARNAVFDIATDLGLKYFLELDDDYKSFQFRFQKGNSLVGREPLNLDAVFDAFIEFLEASDALTVAFSQGGDFIGGLSGGLWKQKIKRKAMNAFFCRTSKPFQFYGRLNEDATMNALLGHRGEKIFTVADLMLIQEQTQANSGGLTDAYLEHGTYLKSIYSVIFCPSAVKIATMGDNYKRIHHSINWNNCAPKILNERYRRF